MPRPSPRVSAERRQGRARYGTSVERSFPYRDKTRANLRLVPATSVTSVKVPDNSPTNGNPKNQHLHTPTDLRPPPTPPHPLPHPPPQQRKRERRGKQKHPIIDPRRAETAVHQVVHHAGATTGGTQQPGDEPEGALGEEVAGLMGIGPVQIRRPSGSGDKHREGGCRRVPEEGGELDGVRRPGGGGLGRGRRPEHCGLRRHGRRSAGGGRRCVRRSRRRGFRRGRRSGRRGRPSQQCGRLPRRLGALPRSFGRRACLPGWRGGLPGRRGRRFSHGGPGPARPSCCRWSAG